MQIHPIKTDSRYTIEQEYCGHAKPHHVLRFCGEWVASSQFLSPMIVRAVGHKAERDGATVIEGMPA